MQARTPAVRQKSLRVRAEDVTKGNLYDYIASPEF
jgi:hypothetical protein